MDKPGLETALKDGCERLGLEVPAAARTQLLRYLEELLRWNQKVNLTSIRDPEEALEKHLLDSLAILPELADARRLLDLGTGGGLPGIPLALALPSLEVGLVDAVAKKVGFLKAVVPAVGLAGRVRAFHLHATGDAAREGLAPADHVVSRAFMDVVEWARLGRCYVAPGGALVAMTGKAPAEIDPAALGFGTVNVRRYALPFSGAERHVLLLR